MDDPTRLGISVRAYQYGRYSGDQASAWDDATATVVCIVDGLGHGKDAEEAARNAVGFVEKNREMELLPLMQACDEELQGTRGAAMAVARIDPSTGLMEYVGVGNTRCAIIGRQVVHPGSVHGIVGEGRHDPVLERHNLERRDVVIFWTDGLPEALQLVATRVRRITNAQAFADQLIDQFAVAEDDAGVVVVRWDA